MCVSLGVVLVCVHSVFHRKIMVHGGSAGLRTRAGRANPQITSNQDMNTLESLDLAGLSDTLNAIRKARATDQDVKSVGENDEPSDSSAKSSALDELSLDSEGNDEDRNKR